MAKRDYYQVLGVGKDADADGLKKAYRKLAMQYHPDRNPDDAEAEAKFREASEAYEVLKEPQKRAAYDRFGHAAFENGGMGGGGAQQGPFDFSSSFSDVFDDLFGDFMGAGRRGRGGRNRGTDLRYHLEITLEEAFAGKRVEITIPTSAPCETCDGSGAKPGTSPSACRTCGGIGRVRAQQGFFTIERTCPSCGGQGQVVTDPCGTCNGSGRQQKDKTLAVSVPQGVEDGTRIRLAGEGDAGARGTQPGDLYLFISIKQHPLFQREGTLVACRVPIPMTTAALGGEIEVPTIDGKTARVRIPTGTQNSTQFRLRGKGMTELQATARGDMFVEIQVEIPKNLTTRQEELLREFAELGEANGKSNGSSERNHPESEGWFAKVREFFGDFRDHGDERKS